MLQKHVLHCFAFSLVREVCSHVVSEQLQAWVHVNAVCLVQLGTLSGLGLGWPAPLQGLNPLKIHLPSCLWCCQSCTHSRHSLPVTHSQGSVQAG